MRAWECPRGRFLVGRSGGLDRCTDDGGPVLIDVPFEVDAPLADGTTDRLVVYLSAVVGAFATPESIGSYEASATMTGEASVRKVGEGE